MLNEYVLPKLPKRQVDGHKGTFGTVLVVGGCDVVEGSGGVVMVGAVGLVARGALRTGCGLVKVAVPDSILQTVLTIEPAATGLALPRKNSGALQASGVAAILDEAKTGVDVIAIGPGFGVGFEQQQILIRLLAEDDLPMVVDADGLNNLAALAEFASDVRAPMVMTPHPGEFARLAEVLGIAFTVNSDAEVRLEAASALAARLGCIVVLKGAGTVVTDGVRSWVCGIREPALATGGSGDVLTGVIAALIAQHGARGVDEGGLGLFDCAVLGVEVHGRCGVVWSAARGDVHGGMLAREIADEVPAVIGAMAE